MDPLLRLLEENALATHETLAAQLDTTPADIKARIKQLEHDRVILAYKAIVDDERAKRTQVKAVIEVRITPEREGGFDRIAHRIAQYREVHSCFLMSGGFDLLVFIEGDTLQEVAGFVSEKLSTLPGVLSTATHFNLKTYKIQGVLRESIVSEERLKVSPSTEAVSKRPVKPMHLPLSSVQSSPDFIADHVREIPRSGIRDFFEIVQSMQGVISLGIGEPDFVTPWHIREAAIYALERGKTGYTSNLGLLRLREAIAEYVSSDYHLQYDPATEVLVTVGVSEALDLALRAVLNPGDEVLYHEPCYVSYSPSIALAHGVAVAVSTREEDEFKLRPAALRAAITPKSKVLLLNFPTNPTGGVLTAGELEEIAAICREHNLLVITDEIYSELSYAEAHTSIASLPDMRERTIFLHGFSKAFAMTGFRIGYACAPAPLIDAMMRIHQYGILCAPIVSQEAALEALRHGRADMLEMREQYRLRRNFLVHAFRKMGLPCFEPRGAFYLFASIKPTGKSSHDFAFGLLKEQQVAVVPGTAFGPSGEGYVRCSYATGMDQLQIAAERIAEFIGKT